MKKIALPFSLFAIFISCAAFIFFSSSVPGRFSLEEKSEQENETKHAMRAKEAAEWRQAKMLDENGEFHSSYYFNAVKQANEFKQQGTRSGAFNLQWDELDFPRLRHEHNG